MANKDSDHDGQDRDDGQRDSDEFHLRRIDPLAGESSALDDARLVAQALGQAPPPSPRINGRYVLLQRLGSGGMGEVFAAFDVDMDRKVAIKFLHLQPGQDASKARQRLKREAKAMARIKTHPNVVPAYDTGIDGSRLYVVMEYIPGPTLLDWQEQEHTLDEVLAAYLQAGRGLAAIHETGQVHRDFKPSNVFVTTDESGSIRVVVGDLGLARATEIGERPDGVDMESEVHAAMPLTATGAQIGTIQYMAPEQLRGEEVTALSDQFAFSVSLYEALCGQRPFRNAESTPAALLDAMKQGLPRDTRQKNGKALPARIERVLRRGLSPEPADRYPDMRTLLADLAPRQHRLWPWIAAGLVVPALALALLSMRRDDPCIDAANIGLAAFWNTDVETRLQERISRAGGTWLARAWETLGRNMERQSSEWYADSIAVCRMDPSDARNELLASSKECLRNNELTLKKVSEAWLGAGSPETPPNPEARLYDDAQMLFSLRNCNVSSTGAPLSPQELPAPRASVPSQESDPLGPKLARIEQLVRAADYGQVTALAREALDELRKPDSDPVVAAEFMYRLGLALTYLEEHAEADRLLGEAADLAAAHDMKALALDVWAYRLKHALVDLDDTNLARSFTAVTRHALKQTGVFDADTIWRAEYEEALGLLASREENHEEAAEHHQKALQIRREEVAPSEPDLATDLHSKSLNNLANVEYAVGRHDQAERLYKEALRLREGLLGPDHPEVGQIRFNLGLIAAHRGDYDDAIDLLARALEIEEKSTARVDRLLSRHLAMGYTELDAHDREDAAGHHENAKRYLERATPHAEAIKALHHRLEQQRRAAMQDKARINEHLFLAGFHSLRQELPGALDQLQAMLRIREQQKDAEACGARQNTYRDDLVSAAYVLCQLNRGDEARAYLEQALNPAVSCPKNNTAAIRKRIQEEIPSPACRP